MSIGQLNKISVQFAPQGGLTAVKKITMPSLLPTDAVNITAGGFGGVALNRLDRLDDVVESANAINNSTLVYNSQTDKYEVKLLDLDGGSF